MRKTIIARSISALAGLGLIGSVGASGFQLLEQNASGLGNAYAGSAAVADNASTVFFNPAGMTRLQAREVSVGLSVVRPSFTFHDDTSSVAPAATGGPGGDAGGHPGWLPNAYFSWAVTPDVYLGLGASAPFGLRTEYDEDWVGRFQSTKFEIKTYNVNPSLAYRVSDKFALGFGVNWQRMEALYERNAATASPALPSAAWPALQATRVKLDVANDAWGWNAGALFSPSETTRVGVSYRSAIRHTLEGTLTSTNQAISPDAAARASITLPDTVIVSVAQQLDDQWESYGDLSWTNWSRIKDVDIWRLGAGGDRVAQTLEARFRDTWRVALGAAYKFNDAWKLKYGVAYDQSPVRNAQYRLVSLPDSDRVWLTLGAQWTPTPTSTLDLGLAYIHIRDAHIDNDQSASGRGRVTGDYSGSVWIAGAQYSQRF